MTDPSRPATLRSGADDDALDSTEETARRLNVRPRTLEDWRRRGIGPEYVRVGQQVRYRRTKVTSWLDARTVHPRHEVAS